MKNVQICCLLRATDLCAMYVIDSNIQMNVKIKIIFMNDEAKKKVVRNMR